MEAIGAERAPVSTSGEVRTQIPASNDLPDCLICLDTINDRTILPNCNHAQFCFDCIHRWSSLRRSCPLCNAAIGAYLIHDVHGPNDWAKFYLRPEERVGTSQDDPFFSRTSTHSSQHASTSTSSSHIPRLTHYNTLSSHRCRTPRSNSPANASSGSSSGHLAHRYHHHEATLAEAEFRRLDQEVAFRRTIYRKQLYAQHMGSNRFSKYKPLLSHDQLRSTSYFSSAPSTSASRHGNSKQQQQLHSRQTSAPAFVSPGEVTQYLQRASAFIRRELQAWPHMDVEFVASYCLEILRSIEWQSDATVRLLRDFFPAMRMARAQDDGGSARDGTDVAQHFVHEVAAFLRSPYKTPREWDRHVQYGVRNTTPAAAQDREEGEEASKRLPSGKRRKMPEADEDGSRRRRKSAYSASSQAEEHSHTTSRVPDQTMDGVASDEIPARRREVIARRADLLASFETDTGKRDTPFLHPTDHSTPLPAAQDTAEREEQAARLKAREARLKCLLTRERKALVNANSV